MFNLFKRKPKIIDKYEDLVNKNHKLRVLLETNKAVAQLENLNVTLNGIFDSIEKSLGYKSSLLLVNNEKNRLEAYNINPATQTMVRFFLGSNSSISVPLDYERKEDMGLAVKAVKTGQVQLTNSMNEVVKPLVPKIVSNGIQTLTGIKYGIVVPIKAKGEVIAVLTGGTSREITPEDIEILSLFADLAGLAINNSRLFTQTLNQVHLLELKEKQQNIIYRVTNQLVSTLDPKLVAKRSVDLIPKEMGYFGAIIVLYDKKLNALVPTAFTTTSFEQATLKLIGTDYSEKYRLPLNNLQGSESSAVEAFLQNKVTVTEDLAKAYSPPLPKAVSIALQKLISIKSVVSVPIDSKGKIVGIVCFSLTDKTEAELLQDDINLMKIFANQIGIALDNANLHNQVEEYSARLKESVDRYLQIAQEQKDVIDIMGHEVRTPLTTVIQEQKLMLDVMLTPEKVENWNQGKIEIPDAQRVLKGIHTMNLATKQAISIVNDMLETARLDKGTFELNYSKFKLLPLIKTAIADSQSRIQSTNKQGAVELISQIDENLEVEADQTRIKQCVDGLLNNAEKYGVDPKTEILTANLEVKQDNGFIVISVTDHGIGIAKEDMVKLGKKFSRLNPYTKAKLTRPGGTGLGLYTFKGIIEHHKGQLLIESEGEGKGSKFSIRFPITKPAEVKQPDAQAADKPAEGNATPQIQPPQPTAVAEPVSTPVTAPAIEAPLSATPVVEAPPVPTPAATDQPNGQTAEGQEGTAGQSEGPGETQPQ